jgi:asparagine synthase (glutamine-hydrolysing)
MCGIAGVYGGGDIRAMTLRLAHRGPDDEGYYEDRLVQLGTRRLAVIDLSTGHQPLATASGSHWITYNGELFNYLELRALLEGEGFRFRTQSDTEVVATAYEAWGARCLERFIGMFAFAIWDGHQLFLARDRMGEKPLFWSQTGDRFLFASEIKSLLVELPREPQLDDDFTTLEAALEPATLFKGIHSLEPGHFLVYDGKNCRQTRYWALPEAEPDPRPEGELVEELRSLLADAVRLRLRSDVPLGLFLSGGLDSSLLACLARPTQVFSCRLPYGVAYDEWEHAQTVARAIGAAQRAVTPTAEDFQRDFARIIWHLEQPIATTSSLAEFSLARLAQRHVKVALGGQGADEAFGGYVRYVFLSEEQRLADAELLAPYRPLARLLWGPDVFTRPADRYFALLQRSGCSETVRRRVHELFSRRGSIVDRMGAADFALTFPSLITMNDRAAAAYGIENRTPFLDHRLIEFAFRLPQRAKIDGFVTKVILRKAARGIVPDSIVDRPDKKGLGVPVGRWLSRELRPWALELAESLARRGIDFAPVGDRGEFDRSLFTKVSLELWFRTFIDNSGAAPLTG